LESSIYWVVPTGHARYRMIFSSAKELAMSRRRIETIAEAVSRDSI
jgi:hypothetical protein